MTLLSRFDIHTSEIEELDINHNELIESIIKRIENIIDLKISFLHKYIEKKVHKDFIKKTNDTYVLWDKNDKCKKEEYILIKSSITFESIIGFKDYLCIYCSWDTNFYSNTQDGYLFWLCVYHSVNMFLEKRTLVKVESDWGPYNNFEMEIKEDKDMSVLFDTMIKIESNKEHDFYKKNKEAFLIPYNLKIEKGSDIIPLLKFSYQEAKKMKIFPKEWEIKKYLPMYKRKK